jgi:hypothetical protein
MFVLLRPHLVAETEAGIQYSDVKGKYLCQWCNIIQDSIR